MLKEISNYNDYILLLIRVSLCPKLSGMVCIDHGSTRFHYTSSIDVCVLV